MFRAVKNTNHLIKWILRGNLFLEAVHNMTLPLKVGVTEKISIYKKVDKDKLYIKIVQLDDISL